MKKFKNIILFCCSLFVFTGLVGCSSPKLVKINNVPTANEIESIQQKATDYFIQARDFERRGLKQFALVAYEKAFQCDPNSELLLEQLVQAYLSNSKFTQALILVKGDKKISELTVVQQRLLAATYLRMNEFGKAAEVLEIIPDKSEEELYQLGFIYETLGKISKAAENFAKFYKKNPSIIQIGFKLGRMYLTEQNYAAAETLFLTMKEQLGEKSEVYNMLAVTKILQRDTTSGIALYEKALSIDSTNEESLRSLAQIYLQKVDYQNAIRCYNTLAQINNFNELYLRPLAILYFYNKDFINAEKLFDRLLQKNIDDSELHYFLGLTFVAQNKSENAKIEFQKAIAIQPEFEDAWKELCYTYIREKNYGMAIKTVNDLCNVKKDIPTAWRLAGYIYSSAKDYNGAIKSFTKAIALDSTDVNTWFELGSAYERNKNIDAAANAFRKVLKLKPNDPAAANYLGYMWAEKGIHLDSAETLLKIALAKHPQNGAYLDSYAWILYQKGDYEKAFQLMQLALMKIPDDPVMFSHLGDIELKRNNLLEAKNAYLKSIEFNSDEADQLRLKIISIETILKNSHELSVQ